MKLVHTVRAWGPERQRQLLLRSGAGVLGLCSVLWLFGPDSDASAALEAEVAQWQARRPPLPEPLPESISAPQAVPAPVVPASAAPGSTLSLPWPGPHQTSSLWPWLQQRAQAQGLQVLALRPQSMETPNPATPSQGTPGAGVSALPEQTVLLQLQGRWSDWLALSADLAAHAPWWLLTHWQVVPAGAGEVRIELQARVGLWPAALQEPGAPVWTGPEWPAKRAAPDMDAELFGLPDANNANGVALPGDVAPAQATPLPISPDPRQWPVHGLRLQGVWQQAGQWHAVLGAGLLQTTVRAGQPVGQEGYRVQTVGPDGVVLRAPSNGPALRLGWQGDKP